MTKEILRSKKNILLKYKANEMNYKRKLEEFREKNSVSKKIVKSSIK